MVRKKSEKRQKNSSQKKRWTDNWVRRREPYPFGPHRSSFGTPEEADRLIWNSFCENNLAAYLHKLNRFKVGIVVKGL